MRMPRGFLTILLMLKSLLTVAQFDMAINAELLAIGVNFVCPGRVDESVDGGICGEMV